MKTNLFRPNQTPAIGHLPAADPYNPSGLESALAALETIYNDNAGDLPDAAPGMMRIAKSVAQAALIANGYSLKMASEPENILPEA